MSVDEMIAKKGNCRVLSLVGYPFSTSTTAPLGVLFPVSLSVFHLSVHYLVFLVDFDAAIAQTLRSSSRGSLPLQVCHSCIQT